MKYQPRIYILLGALFLTNIVTAQSGREIMGINDGWKFFPQGQAYAETVAFKDDNWQSVSLPHTWNAFDVFDDDRTYVRGVSWYRKQLKLDASWKDKQVYVYFEGANQVAHVYVNGYFAGMHKGGYTAFSIDITKYLNWKEGSSNTVAVQVNNAHDPFIPPLNVGYASYGGIYRDAWVIATGKIHFANINNNSGGVSIYTSKLDNNNFATTVTGFISNETSTQQQVKFVNTLYDKQGVIVDTFTNERSVAAKETVSLKTVGHRLKDVQLWSPNQPTLYKMITEVIVNGVVMDRVENKIGFRWFSFDEGNGFSLNGKKLLLRGTNRHQDMKDKGDAFTLEDHRRDLQLIKNMGCNFLRLAHYPQTAAVLSLADELGLLIWEETPVVNFVTDHPDFINNTTTMISEMIRQGYNHPSVILWGSTNEVLLHGPDGERIGRQNDSAYMRVVQRMAKIFDSTVRAEDPNRYSTVAVHISADYAKYGLDAISQVTGYNIYSGWYGGKVEDFANDLDRRKRAGHNVFVSEYGAEGEVRLNTEKPVRMDYTGQYQRYFHESYLRQINQRPWLAGTAIWNEFDFSQPNIGGPAPHMNQKGLVTWDRKPKDAYYLYKANWNPEPMVYIASRDWAIRAGERNSVSTIDVYSNGTTVALSVNGIAQKSQTVNDLKRTTWQVTLKDGTNLITATTKINGKTITDNLVIEYKAYDAKMSLFNQPLSINAGSDAQYLDPSGNVWIEDRLYQQGSF
ncbi:MAG TPA: glycoside hydrolase family 2 TIM barrel-domain containing protein, partial [Chitinophagaceae bacterium]|nr:glycoside hydrolase family 2 TIM barrel-domain containing protein [Chitinophagaceae bacterium]